METGPVPLNLAFNAQKLKLVKAESSGGCPKSMVMSFELHMIVAGSENDVYALIL